MEQGYRLSIILQTQYPLNVHAIRLGKQQPRPHVDFPIPLAAALGLNAGDQVQWGLLDRGELHLQRLAIPPPVAKDIIPTQKGPK